MFFLLFFGSKTRAELNNNEYEIRLKLMNSACSRTFEERMSKDNEKIRQKEQIHELESRSKRKMELIKVSACLI